MCVRYGVRAAHKISTPMEAPVQTRIHPHLQARSEGRVDSSRGEFHPRHKGMHAIPRPGPCFPAENAPLAVQTCDPDALCAQVCRCDVHRVPSVARIAPTTDHLFGPPAIRHAGSRAQRGARTLLSRYKRSLIYLSCMPTSELLAPILHQIFLGHDSLIIHFLPLLQA